MSDVRAGNDIITCEHCGRILYYAPPASAETAQVQPAATS
jgi:hypothetical protein